eukprot:11432561-Ditylum_brightwellii.AAC.1
MAAARMQRCSPILATQSVTRKQLTTLVNRNQSINSIARQLFELILRGCHGEADPIAQHGQP